jgi:galactokinase
VRHPPSAHPKSVAGSRLRDRHHRAFGELPVHLLTVPGRVVLLGLASANHDGLVLSSAIDRHVTVAASPRVDGRVGLLRINEQQPEWFWLHELPPRQRESATDTLRSLLTLLRRKGVHFSGFSLTLHDDIPPGTAFGSEAAGAVALILAIRRMFPFSLTELGAGPAPRRDRRGNLPPLTTAERKILARWCREAHAVHPAAPEARFDPLPSLLSRAWHLTAVDCRFETVDCYSLVGVALVCCGIGLAGADHQITAWEASDQDCYAAARALQAKSLRSVEPAYLRRNRDRLSPTQHARAYHVVGEVQRVVFAERALQEEDHRQLGYYLSSSHDSLRDHWLSMDPELDRLAGLARAFPGCLGTSILGRGPGAAVLCLIPYHQLEPFLDILEKAWLRLSRRPCRPFVLQPVDGAG